MGVSSPLQALAGYEVFVTLKARTIPGAEVVDIREFNMPDGAVLSNARCVTPLLSREVYTCIWVTLGSKCLV